MADPLTLSVIAAAALAALGATCLAALKGWRGWLALKRLELEQGFAAAPRSSARAEIAALRRRVRELEAIASGVDL